ncbi:fibronectin type III domain-containing protein [Streptomyces sp. H10-C2]|uniref:fibronectin type III domain-containing protein n=1 Tax=unclassified Streptomyces TaxID=2593676 RepID=UPI0024BAF642|nr:MULTISPECIES: fibronectin type III domain-containing protein [unclassified Streptomyces]MDJ0341976.1 fibronectin type III domain-containing protein [Streptomyces sp. PH10-H1]MDJ0369949.1 fibronectin type III domain-containing protein [Streptomyces sp. H10-C2]MDJ0370050.1 fibronectin type III domain-containing protein [Streptomyces sp. H10-C2]
MLKQRAGTAASAVWATMRPTRNRSTGYLAIGAVGALIATSVAVGVGASGSIPQLSDIGAWLGSSGTGEATHANGLTGDVDGKVKLPGMNGHAVTIAQDGKTVLVLDKKTGKVVRVDPSQLTAEQSTSYGTSGLQLVSGGTYAYIVDAAKGTVQRIDPALTTPTGDKVELGPGLGAAAVDAQGTLWVPLPGKGTVVPFVNGAKSAEVKVAAPDHDLVLTLAQGQPVVTDRTDAVTKVLSVAGTQQTFNLQGGINDSAPVKILVPAATDSPMVPVLASDSGALALVDVKSGQSINAKVPIQGHALGAPQVLGKKVYIPDGTTGSLLVYDTESSAFQDSVSVTKKAGDLELFVRNGLLWVNDQNNRSAAVINAGGDVHTIGKYTDNVPTARKKNDKPVEDNVPSAHPTGQSRPPARQDPGNSHGPTHTPTPTPTPTPTKAPPPSPGKNCAINWQAGCPEPQTPGTPQAQSGAGTITLTFQPASGLTPKRYVLKGLAGGQTATPSEAGPNGPFTFQVNGGSCGTQYSYTVVAEYAAGAASKESQASAPVRPCVAPGAPQSLDVSNHTGGHGATVSWTAPSGSSGVTYTVTWPGGSSSTQSTSHSVTGLQNSQQYNVSVSTKNAAGSGASTSGTIDLTPPNQTMNITHNNNSASQLAIRTDPSTSTGGRAGLFPAYYQSAVTVHCKIAGESVSHDVSGVTSNIWGKISSSYGNGYVADVYLDSRNNSNVWDCS